MKDKGLAHKPKKAEGLVVDAVDRESLDSNPGIQDVKLNLNYFRECLLDNMGEIRFVIAPFRAVATKSYHGLNGYLNENPARLKAEVTMK